MVRRLFLPVGDVVVPGAVGGGAGPALGGRHGAVEGVLRLAEAGKGVDIAARGGGEADGAPVQHLLQLVASAADGVGVVVVPDLDGESVGVVLPQVLQDSGGDALRLDAYAAGFVFHGGAHGLPPDVVLNAVRSRAVHLNALPVREDDVHVVGLAVVFGRDGDEDLHVAGVAHMDGELRVDVVVLVAQGIEAQVHLYLAALGNEVGGVGRSVCLLVQVRIYGLGTQLLSGSHLDNPVVEYPVALHVHVLVGRLFLRAVGIEVEADVVCAVDVQDDVLVVILAVGGVVVGELLVASVGAHVHHECGALVGLVRLVVGIGGGVVAAVEVVDVLVLSLVLGDGLFVGPPADDFRLEVVEDEQVVHVVRAEANVLSEAVGVGCLSLIDLLHPEVLPRHGDGVLLSLAFLAEFRNDFCPLLFGDVCGSSPVLVPLVAVHVGGTRGLGAHSRAKK